MLANFSQTALLIRAIMVCLLFADAYCCAGMAGLVNLAASPVKRCALCAEQSPGTRAAGGGSVGGSTSTRHCSPSTYDGEEGTSSW